MRLPLALVLLMPAVVYLDVVKFFVPVLSGVALLSLPLLLIWAWIRRGPKRALSKGSLLLTTALLTAYPVVTLFVGRLAEQRIAEQVKQAGSLIAQYRQKNERYPATLKDVELLKDRHMLVSDHAMLVGGRVVTYLRSQDATARGLSKDFAKLSYWSFGAYQRQFFDIGSGTFDSPLID